MEFILFFTIRRGRTPVLRQSAGVGEENHTSLSSLIKMPYLGCRYMPARCVLKQVMLQVKHIIFSDISDNTVTMTPEMPRG